MDISAYHVRKIVADTRHQHESHWVNLTIHERYEGGRDESSEIVLFIRGPNAAALADAYAAAINGVNEPAVSMAEAT